MINAKGFFDSMKKNDPSLYSTIARDYPETMFPGGQMSAAHDSSAPTDSTAPTTDWGSRLLDIIKVIVPAKQQTDLYKMQLRRAEAGLPPIDPSNFAPTVNVGTSPAVLRNIKYLTWGVAGLALIGLIIYARKK